MLEVNIHQRSIDMTIIRNHSLTPCTDTKYKYEIKLSSAGLVYFHFGKEILSVLENKESSDPLVETLYTKLYEKFIQEVDGIDNGIATHDTEGRYTINTNFSSR